VAAPVKVARLLCPHVCLLRQMGPERLRDELDSDHLRVVPGRTAIRTPWR